MKRCFCTYFDHNYMIYGLTMFRSLVETGIDFELFVLCLSDEAFDKLSGLDDRLMPIRLQELEEYDPELKACEQNRSRVEYIFTISPCLPLFLFEKFPHIDLLTYLDADLYFFSSPECLYEELGEKSLYIIEHRFTENMQWRADLYGRFNVAFQIYRNNQTAKDCLHTWRTECLEWCYDREEDGKFADQKYLDTWPERYGNEVVISQNIGANVAPWNLDNYAFQYRNDCVFVNNQQLVFAHYQAFKILTGHFFMWPPQHQSKENNYNFRKLAKVYFRQLKQTSGLFSELFRHWTPQCPARENYEKALKCHRFVEFFLLFIPFFRLNLFIRHLYFRLRRYEGLYLSLR